MILAMTPVGRGVAAVALERARAMDLAFARDAVARTACALDRGARLAPGQAEQPVSAPP
ncbi:MAG: hypothetical protein AMXMBFR66_36130 [Pseudomonadota bacterium]